MRSSAAEPLRAAIRRSRWIIVFAVVLGVAAVNALSLLQGPRYEASARVLVSDRDLGAALTGSAPAFTDPQRLLETELALARSSELSERVAERTGGELGDAAQIADAVRVTGAGTDNVLVFTAGRDEPGLARRTAEAVAEEYPVWRAEIAAAPILDAIRQARGRLAEDPGNAQLREKLDTLTILRTLSTGNVTLVERPTEATQTRPDLVLDSLLGLAIGLVAGLLVAGAREAIDTRVRSEAEVEDALALPVLATVPVLPRGAELVTYGRHRARFEDDFALLAADVEHRRKGAPTTALAVTSANSVQGKSTTAANLAVSLARRGLRVMLVDFDLRKPTVHGILGIPERSVGVVQVLEGEADPIGAKWRCELDAMTPSPYPAPAEAWPREEANEGAGVLDALPSGGAVDAGRAVSLIRPGRLAPLMERLREQYDWIILDTPPAVGALEMTALAGSVDCALVVVRQGRVSRRGLRALERQSRSWSAQPLGAVMTGVRRERGYGDYAAP